MIDLRDVSDEILRLEAAISAAREAAVELQAANAATKASLGPGSNDPSRAGLADVTAAFSYVVSGPVAESAREDLEAIKRAVAEINDAKERSRDVQGERNEQASAMAMRDDPSDPLGVASIVASASLPKTAELAEVASLRLQQYLDRYSMLMQILSNLLYAVAETARGIISNLEGSSGPGSEAGQEAPSILVDPRLEALTLLMADIRLGMAAISVPSINPSPDIDSDAMPRARSSAKSGDRGSARGEMSMDSPIGAAVGGSSQGQLLDATKQLQETQMSFNPTSHNTAQDSINNVRGDEHAPGSHSGATPERTKQPRTATAGAATVIVVIALLIAGAIAGGTPTPSPVPVGAAAGPTRPGDGQSDGPGSPSGAGATLATARTRSTSTSPPASFAPGAASSVAPTVAATDAPSPPVGATATPAAFADRVSDGAAKLAGLQIQPTRHSRPSTSTRSQRTPRIWATLPMRTSRG